MPLLLRIDHKLEVRTVEAKNLPATAASDEPADTYCMSCRGGGVLGGKGRGGKGRVVWEKEEGGLVICSQACRVYTRKDKGEERN